MRNAASLKATAHDCRYREEVVWTRWKRLGALTERFARRVPLCQVCGKEQPDRQPHPPVLREVRAKVEGEPPAVDATGSIIATALVRLGRGREGLLPTGNFFDALKHRGIPPSVVEQWIEAFLIAGWLTVVWRPGKPPVVVAVALRRPRPLRDLSRAWRKQVAEGARKGG
jgi:hypothetical protein